MDSLKRNNLKPENFCIVDPLDLLFGPKLLNK